MYFQVSVWLDESSEEDAKLIRCVQVVGIRTMATHIKCSPSLLSRWLRGQTGLSAEKYDQVTHVISQVKNDFVG